VTAGAPTPQEGPPRASRDEVARVPAQTDAGGEWLLEGRAAFERGRIADAIDCFRRVIDAGSAAPEAYLYLGIALAKDAQVYEAIDIFEAGLALAPDDFMLNLTLADLYFRLSVPDKGRRYLQVARDGCSTPSGRQLVQALLSREADREKRRIDRPTFERS